MEDNNPQTQNELSAKTEAQERLDTALSLLPLQRMTKEDVVAWLEEEEY